MSVDTRKIIEDTKGLVEVWLFLETHFNRQTTPRTALFTTYS
jgi:hypothetical protein